MGENDSVLTGSCAGVPHSIREAGHAVREVHAASFRFIEAPYLGSAERAKLLRAIIPRLEEEAVGITRAACEEKGIDYESPVAGEEMLHVALMIRMARLLADDLEADTRQRPPSAGLTKRRLSDGAWEVDVFPASRIDAMLFKGFRGSVRLHPVAAKPREVPRVKPTLHPRTCLVLGAGNVSSIPLMDVFSKMFIEGMCCVLKMNPANDWLGPFLERACQPIIRPGFLRIVYGGADVGEHLCHHPQIDEVHLTGSEATHDAIVWGPPGPERNARKAYGNPLVKKPVTAELGNVSPVIVTPGLYSRRELRFMAKNIVTMLVNNAGFNCNAARVLVTAKSWNLRPAFLDALRKELAAAQPRIPYYPGARQRYLHLTIGRRDVEQTDVPNVTITKGPLPWAFVPGLNPNVDDPLFRTEAFCGILAEVAIDAIQTEQFLSSAVTFANERLHGTLNATLFVDRHSSGQPFIASAIERTIANLRYGTVAVNHWGALGYGFVTTPWGAYPGSTAIDPQSGNGWVHNTFRLANVEKVVIRGPLTAWPTPPWFHDNRNAYHVARRLVELEASPSLGRALSVMRAALGF